MTAPIPHRHPASLELMARHRPLTDEEYAQLRTVTWTEGAGAPGVKGLQSGDKTLSEGDTCAICLDDFAHGDLLRVLPCDHALHDRCLEPWLKCQKSYCPLCKAHVRPESTRRSETESEAGESRGLEQAQPGSPSQAPRARDPEVGQGVGVVVPSPARQGVRLNDSAFRSFLRRLREASVAPGPQVGRGVGRLAV